MLVRLISVRRRKLFCNGFFKFSNVILCYDSLCVDVRWHNNRSVLDSVGFIEYTLEPLTNSPSSVASAQRVRASSHRMIGKIIRLLDFLSSQHFSDTVQAKNRTDMPIIDREANKQIAGYMQSYT